MKEFDYEVVDIYDGITPLRIDRKSEPKLIDCHNIEPFKEEYDIHEFIIYMNTDDYDWGNP